MQGSLCSIFVRNDLLNYDADSFQALSSKFADKLEKIAAELRDRNIFCKGEAGR